MSEEQAGCCYYQVTTREDVSYYRCGEVGDIQKKTSSGADPITSVRFLPDGRLEVQVAVDERRRQEVLDMQRMDIGFRGSLTPDGLEVCIVSNAFLTWEEAQAHAIHPIEAEIARLRQKLETIRHGRMPGGGTPPGMR